MVYNSQKGYGLKDLFRNITRPFKPLLKPVLEGVKDVGLNLAGDLIGDLVCGKTSKASIKERGKQAKNMAVQRALQTFLKVEVEIFHPAVWGGAVKQQNVNEVVQKVRPQRNGNDLSRNRQNVNGPKLELFIPPFIIPQGIILVTTG